MTDKLIVDPIGGFQESVITDRLNEDFGPPDFKSMKILSDGLSNSLRDLCEIIQVPDENYGIEVPIESNKQIGRIYLTGSRIWRNADSEYLHGASCIEFYPSNGVDLSQILMGNNIPGIIRVNESDAVEVYCFFKDSYQAPQNGLAQKIVRNNRGINRVILDQTNFDLLAEDNKFNEVYQTLMGSLHILDIAVMIIEDHEDLNEHLKVCGCGL